MHCARSSNDARIWRTPDAIHVDLRGLDPPEPMVTVLQMIDRGEVDGVLVAHFDREPIFLYSELDDRGWSHEIIPDDHGSCTDDFKVQIARYGR